MLILASCANKPTISDNFLPNWAFGWFNRPEGVNPIIEPDDQVKFYCPMKKDSIGWESSDTFNPAAVVKDGKIDILYRAEDNSATVIGHRTSRIGLTESIDGIQMDRRKIPVLYPNEDDAKEFEWEGNPRLAVTEDVTCVMTYTSWNRQIRPLCIATSKDLTTWTKHGSASSQPYDGRFGDLESKSGSIVTK